MLEPRQEGAIALPAAQWAALEAAYSAPPRAYHGWPHVKAVLQHYHEVATGPGWAQPVEAWLGPLNHERKLPKKAGNTVIAYIHRIIALTGDQDPVPHGGENQCERIRRPHPCQPGPPEPDGGTAVQTQPHPLAVIEGQDVSTQGEKQVDAEFPVRQHRPDEFGQPGKL